MIQKYSVSIDAVKSATSESTAVDVKEFNPNEYDSEVEIKKISDKVVSSYRSCSGYHIWLKYNSLNAKRRLSKDAQYHALEGDSYIFFPPFHFSRLIDCELESYIYVINICIVRIA